MCGVKGGNIEKDLIYVITLFVTAIRTNYAMKMYRWLKQFIAATRLVTGKSPSWEHAGSLMFDSSQLWLPSGLNLIINLSLNQPYLTSPASYPEAHSP
jgi:hypothetical protein